MSNTHISLRQQPLLVYLWLQAEQGGTHTCGCKKIIPTGMSEIIAQTVLFGGTFSEGRLASSVYFHLFFFARTTQGIRAPMEVPERGHL